MSSLPSVSIVLPVLDARGMIEAAVETWLSQTYEGDFSLMVLDGGSTDGTREWLDEASAHTDRLDVRSNPQRSVPHARNLALHDVEMELILEAHAAITVPEDHLEQRIADLLDLEAELGCHIGGIGTLVRPSHDPSIVQGWVETALRTPLGHSGGQFEPFTGREPTQVASFILLRRDAVLEVNGWDPEFITNQDSDLVLRLIEAGKPVWRSDVSHVRMEGRGSLRGLLAMARRYGYWRMPLARRDRRRLRVREFLPLLGVIMTLASFPIQPWIAAGLVLSYAGALGFMCLRSAWTSGEISYIFGVPICLILLHVGFTYGLVGGIFRPGRAISDRNVRNIG